MISSKLTRIERVACENCNAFAPDCMAPVDERTLALCWFCAHMVTEHEHEVGTIIDASVCTCAESDIFPPDIAELRQLRRDREDAAARGEILDRDRTQSDYVAQPEFVGRHSKRWADKVAARGGVVHGDGRGFHGPNASPDNPYGMSSTSLAVAAMNKARLEVLAAEGKLPQVESFRTIAPEDSFARDRGYTSHTRPDQLVARYVGEKPSR